MQILVTGATGTVGSFLVERLLQRGARVRALTLSPRVAQTPGLEYHLFNPADPGAYLAATAGVDAMYLLTPVTADQVAIGIAFVDAAIRSGVRRVVKQSGTIMDEPRRIFLDELHAPIERLLEVSGMSVAFVRPTPFMQNFLTYYPPDERGKIYLPLGGGRVAYVDARDVANVGATLLTGQAHREGGVPVSGPQALTVNEVAMSLSRAWGRTIEFVDVPPQAARQAMLGQGMPVWLIEGLLEQFAANQRGANSKISTSIRDLTTLEPVTFDQFAKDFPRRAAGRS